MTRVLLIYTTTAERKLVARRATRLAARGVDVDLAPAAAAATLPAGWYDRVLDASTIEPLPVVEGVEGVVRIVSANMGAAVASTVARAAPAAPPTRGHVIASLLVGAVAVVVLGLLGLPVAYTFGAGVLVALATSAMLRGRDAAPATAFTPSTPSAVPTGHALHIA